MVVTCHPGNELELFASARTRCDDWTSLVAGFRTGVVHEVVAGVGSTTRLIRTSARTWCATEPDPGTAAKLEECAASGVPRKVPAACGSVASLPSTSARDAILCAALPETIDDDAVEKESSSRPAPCWWTARRARTSAPWPLGSVRRACRGHHRRYTAQSVRAIVSADDQEPAVTYVDSVGMLASMANRWALRSSRPPPRRIRLWDQRIEPLSGSLNPLFGHRLGKSVVTVWVSRSGGGRQHDVA
jgi:hypothetical protein